MKNPLPPGRPPDELNAVWVVWWRTDVVELILSCELESKKRQLIRLDNFKAVLIMKLRILDLILKKIIFKIELKL